MAYKQPLATSTDYGLVKAGTGVSIVAGVLDATGLPYISYYGKFYSPSTQTNPVVSTANIIQVPNTTFANGITTSGGNITFQNSGIYTVTYEVQSEITSGGGGNIDIWARINGIDYPQSNSIHFLAGGGVIQVLNRSFLLNLQDGDVVNMVWSSPIANMRLTATGPQVNPVRPTTNSANILATLVQAT